MIFLFCNVELNFGIQLQNGTGLYNSELQILNVPSLYILKFLLSMQSNFDVLFEGNCVYR